MSHPPSTLLDRLSPMPMVCPLVKLGRSSPPTADQGYHTALETQLCHNASNEPSEEYNFIRSTNLEQNYHGDNSYTKYSNKKHMYADIYSELQNDPLTDNSCKQQNPTDNVYQHKNSAGFMPEYETHKNVQGQYSSQGLCHRKDNKCPHQLGNPPLEQYCAICEQSSNHSSSSLDCEQTCQQKHNYYGGSNVDYYQKKTVLELSSLSVNDRYWGGIHNKSSEQCQTKAMCRHRGISQDFYSRNVRSDQRISSPTLFSCNYLVDNFNKLGKSSPNLDQGYHTLVSPSPGPSIANPWAETNMNANLFKGKKVHSKNNSFDKLPDDVALKIFSWLHSYDLSVCARVCRRFETLAWRPSLWRTITLYGEHISGDKAIRGVLRQLCGQGRTGACPSIEKVYLSDGVKLTDRGLILLARRCPELTHLQIHGCTDITNPALFELVTRCTNLQHLDITGCINVSCISVIPGSEPPRRLFLQYLDLTDCTGIEDNGLRIIVRNCPQLVYLYLRRCIQITDAGLKHVPSFCLGLRELSVSDCTKVTDFGLYELAKLGATLRYLSVAKCDQVSDAGLKVIARRCYKLRYLNARGCEAVSDDAITVLARSCTRLRALDIGKCDVSDAGLRALAESCPNIKKLSLRNCDLVTDRGVQCIAYYCRGLQQLNIQDCQISLEGYRAVKKYCKRCIIEHTNPGFF